MRCSHFTDPVGLAVLKMCSSEEHLLLVPSLELEKSSNQFCDCFVPV